MQWKIVDDGVMFYKRSNRHLWIVCKNSEVVKESNALKKHKDYMEIEAELFGHYLSLRDKSGMKVLSIDAWAEGSRDWSWNAWYTVGTIWKKEFETLETNRQILKWFRVSGYTTQMSVGKLTVDDDGYNKVVVLSTTRQPLFAIEYGPHY